MDDKPKRVRKPRAKKTETTAPRVTYKAPGSRGGFLNTMLSTVSRDVVNFRLNYNPAQVEATKAAYKARMQSMLSSKKIARL